MRRREFITTLGTVAATWLSSGLSGAQESTRVVGVLAGTTETDPQAQRRVLVAKNSSDGERLGYILSLAGQVTNQIQFA